MERYRSGHNGTDSKSHTTNGSQSSKNPLFYWIFETLKTEYFSKFSPSILSFFRGLILRYSWSGIEVVITGLTRNQLRGNPPWVRIPPAPPRKASKPNGFWLFFLFALGCELLRCTFGPNSLLDAASSNSQTAEQCIC